MFPPPVSPPSPEIELSDLQSLLRVDRPRLVALLSHALRSFGVDSATLSILLVDDRAMQTINARHLEHDYPTDVITFPLSGPDDRPLAGEIVISTETARSVAAELKVDPLREVELYAVHGVLHLLGFDDQDEDSRAGMMTRQQALIATFDDQAAASHCQAHGGEVAPCSPST